MSAVSGEPALGRYRIGEKRAGPLDSAVFDAVDPRRPEIRVRLVVVPGFSTAQAAPAVEQTRRYALGTPALATAARAGEVALPGFEGRRVVLAFELGTGWTLDDLAASGAGFDVRRALGVIQNTARALAALHDQGIGHGFVLPALLAVDAADKVTLGGYGVAQLAGSGAAEPRADAFALRALARDLLARLLPADLAGNAEIARRLEPAAETLPQDIVQWAEELASAVHGELSKPAPAPPPLETPQPPVTPPPSPAAPPEYAASDVSRTPPAVVVSHPPPVRRPEPSAGKRPAVGSWVIGAALALALLLLVGVVAGVFAHSVFISKRGKTPEASGAASAASIAEGPSAQPPAPQKQPAPGAEPAPDDSAAPVPDPLARAPEAATSRGAVRRGSAAPASDAEAALPVSPASPVKAAPDALVTVVLFGDLECPHTRSAYQTLTELERLFPGDLRLVWRHRPLREHGHARDAAEFAAALHDEDGATAFWRLVADVSKSDDPANREWLAAWATRQERAFSGFRAPATNAAAAARVEEDLALANRFGVRETPTLFINGLRVKGDRPLDELRGLIARELREARALLGAGVPASFIYTTRVTKNLIGIGPEVAERTCPPLEKSPRRGAVPALATLVVFSDFQCPYCRRMQPTLKRLETKYANELAIVWKNLPLQQHPSATPAARLALGARAAGGDSRFWLVHDLLFRADPALDPATLQSVAQNAGVDANLLMEAVQRGDHQSEIDADVALARRLGVTGTPTIFVNGRRVGGAQPLSSFESLVREELQTAERLIERGVKRENLYATLCGETE